MYEIKADEKCGFMDAAGRIVIEPRFESVGEPGPDGWIKIKLNGKWGYADTRGNIVLEPVYDLIMEFSEGLAAVRIDGKDGFVDREGGIVIPPQFHNTGSFHRGLAAVEVEHEPSPTDLSPRDDTRWGYIDKTGRFVIPPKFREVSRFPGGPMFVVFPGDSDKYAVDGQLRAVNGPFMWVDAWTWPSDGRCRVTIPDGPGGRLYGVIGEDGQYLIEPEFEILCPLFEGLAVAGEWDGQGGQRLGYVDEAGEYVIPIQFEKARRFSEGLAPVRLNGRWVYIDRTGQVALDPPHENIARLEGFHNGLATANVGGTEHPKGFVEGGKWGYIDRTGAWVIPPRFDSATCFDEHSVAAVWIGDKRGYINRQGAYIWVPTK